MRWDEVWAINLHVFLSEAVDVLRGGGKEELGVQEEREGVRILPAARLLSSSLSSKSFSASFSSSC